MRIAPILLVATLLLTTTPSADALLSPRPFEVTVPHSRVGDTMRYALSSEVEALEGEEEGAAEESVAHPMSTVVHVEGFARARDRFGVERDTVARVVQEETLDGTPYYAERCHALLGGVEAVRREILSGTTSTTTGFRMQMNSGTSVGLPQTSSHFARQDDRLVVFDPAPCNGPPELSGRTFREGDRVVVSTVFGSSLASEPAEETTFHDRRALLLRFRVEEATEMALVTGTVEAIIADGIPGLARASSDVTLSIRALTTDAGGGSGGCDTHGNVCEVSTDVTVAYADTTMRVRGVYELVAFVEGDGPAIPPPGDAAIPAVSPDGGFVPYDRLAFDDAALELAYPVTEAVAALRADPTAEFSDYLAEHPEAALLVASYDRRAKAAGFERLDTDGGWEFLYSDGDVSYCASVRRPSGVTTPLGAAEFPVKVSRTQECSATERMLATIAYPGTVTATARLADSHALAATMERSGIERGGIEHLTYTVGGDFASTVFGVEAPPFIVVSEVSEANPNASPSNRGLTLHVDATTAGLVAVDSTIIERSSAAPLDPFPENARFSSGEHLGGFSAIVGPAPGTGLAVGTVTLAALLALALKFLVLPFYTRLRRDRLLDDPVRARLMRCALENPGVHRAALEDVAGVGEGATRHHLDQLVRHRLLVELKSDGFARYYAAGAVPPEVARREAVLRAGSNRRVYDALVVEPGLSLREAGRKLGLSAPSVHRAVRRLRAAGLIPPREGLTP